VHIHISFKRDAYIEGGKMLSKSGPVFTNELCSLILDKNHRTNIQLYPSYTILLPLKSRFVSVLKLEPHHEDIHCLIKYREMETY